MVGIDNKFDKYYLLHFFNSKIILSYSNSIANDNHSGSFKHAISCVLLQKPLFLLLHIIPHLQPGLDGLFPQLICPCHHLSPLWVVAYPPVYISMFSLLLHPGNGVPLRDTKVNLKLAHQLKPLGIYFSRTLAKALWMGSHDYSTPQAPHHGTRLEDSINFADNQWCIRASPGLQLKNLENRCKMQYEKWKNIMHSKHIVL